MWHACIQLPRERERACYSHAWERSILIGIGTHRLFCIIFLCRCIQVIEQGLKWLGCNPPHQYLLQHITDLRKGSAPLLCQRHEVTRKCWAGGQDGAVIIDVAGRSIVSDLCGLTVSQVNLVLRGVGSLLTPEALIKRPPSGNRTFLWPPPMAKGQH